MNGKKGRKIVEDNKKVLKEECEKVLKDMRKYRRM